MNNNNNNNRFTDSMLALESKNYRGNYSDDKKFKIRPSERTVCKFWILNGCKKGEACDFLHENDKNKFPECPNYEKDGNKTK